MSHPATEISGISEIDWILVVMRVDLKSISVGTVGLGWGWRWVGLAMGWVGLDWVGLGWAGFFLLTTNVQG